MRIRPQAPCISVIVPACNAAGTLAACLTALRSSSLSRDLWELIVVDDASTDGSARIASTLADGVVCLPGPPHGPAYARNRGAEAARGDILLFVDPTVAVAPEALERLVTAFDSAPGLSAACGAWESDPAANVTAGYYALCRLFEQIPGHPSAFSAVLGAVRARVFAEVGPFDEWLYPRSSVEDTELGHRLRLAGHRAARLPDVRATRLDSARLRTILWDEVRARVLPGTRLALHVGGRRADPRLGRLFLSGTFALIAMLALLVSPWSGSTGAIWLGGFAILGLAGADRDLLRYAARTRGPFFCVAALPLHVGASAARAVGASVGWCAHHLVGPPRVPLEVFARSADDPPGPLWPPPPVQPTHSVWARPPYRRSRRAA